jgi:hypothetical protein
MPEVIDLDKLGAVRREAKEEKPVVRFGGEEFQLPPEMPFAVIEAVSRLKPNEDGETDTGAIAESMGDIARALFGKKYRKFLDLGPSTEDITALLENMTEAYGLKTEEEVESEPEETPAP